MNKMRFYIKMGKYILYLFGLPLYIIALPVSLGNYLLDNTNIFDNVNIDWLEAGVLSLQTIWGLGLIVCAFLIFK